MILQEEAALSRRLCLLALYVVPLASCPVHIMGDAAPHSPEAGTGRMCSKMLGGTVQAVIPRWCAGRSPRLPSDSSSAAPSCGNDEL
ncbi:hypothetical protein E2C01_027992 [Portunus trituberculatus]|uniref:Secreted protein n=1 Tax=Portunus trituberculatus TaxID=210409 RepID=A0A5B7EMU7_PORTR|nr:hypothetical protein [Portunus trituberculatus]